MARASDSAKQERLLARWYETFLDVVKAAKRRGYGIACNPADKTMIQDMLERVHEDTLWGMGDLPPLLVHSSVERGTYRLVDDKTLRLISFASAVNSKRGLGRFSKVYTPAEAMRRRDM